MSDELQQFLAMDLPPMLTALFAALSCALLGNFLVLRKISLMGDAISHAVLPGIVAAFLLSGTRTTLSVFIGAAVAAILCAVCIELVRRLGKIEAGAAMGVVFAIFFALGVLMMEQAAARNVDLDADCLLHGQLETIFWFPPSEWSEMFRLSTLSELPSELVASAIVLLLSALFVSLFFKELMLSAFDSDLGTALGFNASFLHYLLMIFVAMGVVASFEAVGSILVIAMIICPAATARFYTDRLRRQILLSLTFASVTAIGGYVIAGFGPGWIGLSSSVNAAGMMTVVAGLLLLISALFAPQYGIISQFLRGRALGRLVLQEDILTYMYRCEERDTNHRVTSEEIRTSFQGRGSVVYAVRRLVQTGQLTYDEDDYLFLTDTGREKAKHIIRSHRLWESYLVDEAGLSPTHVHESAEKMEHFTKADLAGQLAESQSNPERDPHGRKIPE